MNEHHEQLHKQPRPAPSPMPEFFMPAMPPLALTEGMDRLYRRWSQRRQLRRLLKLKDDQLAALGASRADLQWAARQPLKEDVFDALRKHREEAHSSRVVS